MVYRLAPHLPIPQLSRQQREPLRVRAVKRFRLLSNFVCRVRRLRRQEERKGSGGHPTPRQRADRPLHSCFFLFTGKRKAKGAGTSRVPAEGRSPLLSCFSLFTGKRKARGAGTSRDLAEGGRPSALLLFPLHRQVDRKGSGDTRALAEGRSPLLSCFSLFTDKRKARGAGTPAPWQRAVSPLLSCFFLFTGKRKGKGAGTSRAPAEGGQPSALLLFPLHRHIDRTPD